MFFVSLLIFINCSDNNSKYRELNIKKIEYTNQASVRFDDYFEIMDTIIIPISRKNNLNIMYISKIIEVEKNKLLVLDMSNAALFLLDTLGIISKQIAQRGNGPGEFYSITDFCIDDKSNIYVLDRKGKVGQFLSNGDFVKFFELSYLHRIPDAIKYLDNGNFLITSFLNLVEGSTKNSYKFVDYFGIKYLHIYNNEFKKIKSFFEPAPEFEETKGQLVFKCKGAFVVNEIYSDEILAFSQDGLYRLKTYNKTGELLKIFEFDGSNFENFDFPAIKGLPFSTKSRKIGLEKIGKIIAGHSTIRGINRIGDYFLLTKYGPYDNYYPEYKTGVEESLAYDIFNYSNNIVTPIVSDIYGKYRIVGTGGKGIIYFTPFDPDEENIVLFKAKLIL